MIESTSDLRHSALSSPLLPSPLLPSSPLTARHFFLAQPPLSSLSLSCSCSCSWSSDDRARPPVGGGLGLGLLSPTPPTSTSSYSEESPPPPSAVLNLWAFRERQVERRGRGGLRVPTYIVCTIVGKSKSWRENLTDEKVETRKLRPCEGTDTYTEQQQKRSENIHPPQRGDHQRAREVYY